MDNLETELAWLAGIIDGEGYIGLRVQDGKYMRPNAYSRRGFSKHIICVIRVETVSVSMITAISLILDKISIAYSMIKPYMKKNSTLPLIKIEVHRKGDLLRLCNILIPYAVVKKQELQLLYNYLIKSIAYRFYQLTQSDIELAGKMRKLHDINGSKGKSLAVKSKPININGHDNAELNSDNKISDKRVEHIETTTQLELKTCADTP